MFFKNRVVYGMEKVFEVAEIIAAAMSGKLTENDLETLEEWLKQSPENSLLYHHILEKENIRAAGKLLHKFDKRKGWENISRHISSKRILRKKKWLRFAKYAAILILSSGIWLLLNHHNSTQPPVNVTEHQLPTDSCISQGIVLKLSDGKVLNLKENKGQIKITGHQFMANNSEKTLSYKEINTHEDLSQTLNEIYVNRGEIYHLELCDGSYIHLNSMSRIKYPVHFAQNDRTIELEGEAYLQVAKDTIRPFIVKTKDFNIKVLGTQFNITAYPEDSCIVTTLVEGAVQVESRKFQVSAQLQPHEQFLYNKSNRHQQLEHTDISYATAWMQGKIRYRDITLENLMTILKRWYDIEVEYDTPEIRDIVFGCHFNRMDSIDKIIEVFEQTKKIKIERSGKKLRFMNYSKQIQTLN